MEQADATEIAPAEDDGDSSSTNSEEAVAEAVPAETAPETEDANLILPLAAAVLSLHTAPAATVILPTLVSPCAEQPCKELDTADREAKKELTDASASAKTEVDDDGLDFSKIILPTADAAVIHPTASASILPTPGDKSSGPEIADRVAEENSMTGKRCFQTRALRRHAICCLLNCERLIPAHRAHLC